MVANAFSAAWRPTKIRRVEATFDTGTEVVAVVTDAGPAFVKLLGNREGPHVLACEFVGTRLAALLGLPIFDYAVMPFDGSPAITLHSGRQAEAGSAWITRREEGFPWGGNADDLRLLDNPSDLAKLVLLDQWTRNCDRYRPEPRLRINRRNVFFSRENAPPGRFRLMAMDHTHCFTCGSPLTPAIARIDHVQDPIRYGLFPEFAGVIQRPDVAAAIEALSGVADASIQAVVAALPADWQVDAPTRQAWSEYLARRRDWLKGTFLHQLFPQDELFA